MSSQVKSLLLKFQDTKCSILCSRLGAFMLIFTICFYLESMGSSYIITAIQSIERQFQITSRMSGTLVSAHEIGYIPTVIILSYLGSRGNRARWISVGCLLTASGALLLCMPNFIFPAKIPPLNETMLDGLLKDKTHKMGRNELIQKAVSPAGFCDAGVNRLRQLIEEDKCAQTQTNDAAVGMIFVALMILGIGHSMPWTLGVPLLDDNVKKTNMPLYFSIFFVIKVAGPISSFFMGAFTSSMYVTLTTPTGLTRSDPRWIGAWWLGFLVISLGLFGPSIALGCFTDKRSNSNGVRKTSLKLVDQHTNKESTHLDQGLFAQIKRFGQALVIILKSPIYTGAVVGRVLDAFAFKGFFTFLPKYFENHYGMPQYQANIVIGCAGIVAVLFGVLGGSVAMRRLKLEGRKAALWVAVCSLIAAVLSIVKIFFGCHSVVNNIGQMGMENNFNFTNTCNADCLCTDIKLLPVCSSSGNAYFSPCHAGCEVVTGKAFTNCSCIDVGTNVQREWCGHNCQAMLVIYIITLILAAFVNSLATTPGILIVLRSVPAAQRSMSMGVNAFAISLGTLAAPVFFGSIIDSSCLLWEDTCQGKGACSIYEPTKMRVGIHVLMGILKGLALVTDVWVWYWAKDLNIMTEEEEDESQAKDTEISTVNMTDMNLHKTMIHVD